MRVARGRSLVALLVLVAGLFGAAPAVAVPPPNIVVILTDDQPVRTLQLMEHVQALRSRGVTFHDAVASNALCCPSRATILTGLYSHSTGVYTNGDADEAIGGYRAFEENGNLDRTIAVSLDGAGYRTGLFGKFLNHYTRDDPVPPGWDQFHAIVGTNGRYYGYEAVHAWAGGPVNHRSYGFDPADYSTSVFGRRALRFLHGQDATTPFFLFFAPFAPHGPRTPAVRDADVTAPGDYRTLAWNEADVSDKPPYIRTLPPISRDLSDPWDSQYGSLESVDRWLGRFRTELADRRLLSRTVFVFLSDNGFTWGDHRFNYKRAPYERSIGVPFVLSGPGIPHRGIRTVVANVDLAPTLLDLAGVAAGPFDGRSLVPLFDGGSLGRRAVLLEHARDPEHGIPSYCGLRTPRWKYVAYAGGFEEVYDLRRDPNELRNRAGPGMWHIDELRQETRRRCDPLPPGFPDGFWDALD